MQSCVDGRRAFFFSLMLGLLVDAGLKTTVGGTTLQSIMKDGSNDTPQPICECLVSFPLLWIKDYPGLS